MNKPKSKTIEELLNLFRTTEYLDNEQLNEFWLSAQETNVLVEALEVLQVVHKTKKRQNIVDKILRILNK